MTLDDLIGLCIFGSFFLMLALEALFPARGYPSRRFWRLKGFLFLIAMAAVATLTPLLLPVEWLAAHRLIDGTSLGVTGGTVVGYVVFSFFGYLWHRAQHRFGFLWRTFHQIHHAPARLDLGGAAVFHPFEVAAYVVLTTLTSTLVLGLRPEAAALTGLVAQLYSFFQHLNVKTPRFLGYVIQRPEGHFVHHQRDVHAYNYGDFPLWDLLFGTFRNPAGFGKEDVGFAEPADRRLGAMLLFRDVSESAGTRVQKQGSTESAARAPRSLHETA
jgi:sterol desaturase/sphingolipid hydroxylase (fatty acid hydroxylase superfamily)